MSKTKKILPLLLIFCIAVCCFAAACSSTKSWTVTFDSDGGTEVAAQAVTDGSKATEPEDPTKDGYEFDGWYLDGSAYDFSTAVSADITLTAQWTQLFTVTFDANGGSSVSSQTVRSGESATAPTDPTRSGYEFDGWYLNGSAYNFSTEVTANITLTAKWTILSYSVTFDSDGGSEVTAQTVNYGSVATAPADPTKEGYDFDGWYLNGSAYSFSDAVTANITLTAKWTQLFTVTFDVNGGTGTYTAQTIRDGETATAPETNPTLEGYAFGGWYSGNSAFDFSTAITADTTLTAKWLQLYTVTFDVDGDTSTYAAQTVSEGSCATAPETNPAKTGYDFDGWYLNGSAFDFTTAITGNITLIAQFTQLFTVTFNSDGGTAVASQTVRNGSTASFSSISEKEGYIFYAWYNESSEYDFTTAVTADLTLTAKWITLSEVTASEFMLTAISVDASAAVVEYNVGEALSTDNVKATITLIGDDGFTRTITVDASVITFDTTNVDISAAGTYTIYVSYALGNVTRYASYEITITSQLSGIHGIELTKTITSYNVALTADEIAAIALDDLTVYSVNSDGTLGDVITDNITWSYYVGANAVEESKLTNEDVLIFQIWASVPYTVGNETYYMKDFVTVEIIGDVAEKLTWKSGTIEQAASYTDLISSTWVFEADMTLSGAKTITLADLTVGTGANQYTVEIVTAITGSYKAVVTYYYTLGTKVASQTCEVSYTVTNATADEEYSLLIDVNVGTNDSDSSTVTPDYTITASLAAGDVIVPGMVYAYGSGLATNTENKYDSETGKIRLYGRVQFSGSRGITVYLGGASTITFYARYGSSSGSGAAYVATNASGEKVATSTTISNTSKWEVVTLTFTEAGVYNIITDGNSLNTFRFSIEGKIEKYVPAAEGVSVNIDEWLTTNSSYATTSVTSTVTLATGISVWCTDGKTTFSTANSKGCIKTGGTMNSNGRAIVVEVQAGATITLTATTGSNGNERYLKMCTLSGTTYTQVGSNQSVGSVSSTIATVTFTATDAGTYYIGSTDSGISIYSIAISY